MNLHHAPLIRHSWMNALVFSLAPMARITVAPLVTMSPPVKIPFYHSPFVK
jgi:hypothetical protein